MSKFNNSLKKIHKFWLSYFTPKQRKVIVFLTILVILATFISMTVYGSFQWNKDYVKKTVCLSAMKEYTLQYQNLPLIKLILLEYGFIFKLLIGSIGVGWVLHGVGFKVIGK